MSSRDLTLPAEPASVPRARHFVRERLIALHAEGACDVAEALLSELATNAVLHARTPFTVEVSRAGDVLRVCVLDASPVPARMRRYGAESTTGRGLRLVATQATDWGVEVQRPGKVIWFEVPADGGGDDAVSWEADVDVDVLLASFDEDAGDAAGSRGAGAYAGCGAGRRSRVA